MQNPVSYTDLSSSPLPKQTIIELHNQFEQAFSAILTLLQAETELLTQAQTNINEPLLALIDQKQPHLSLLQSLHEKASQIVSDNHAKNWETLLLQLIEKPTFNNPSIASPKKLISQWQTIKKLQQQVQTQNQTNARLLQYREQRAERLHQQLSGETTNTPPSYNQQGYGVRSNTHRSQNQTKA